MTNDPRTSAEAREARHDVVLGLGLTLTVLIGAALAFMALNPSQPQLPVPSAGKGSADGIAKIGAISTIKPKDAEVEANKKPAFELSAVDATTGGRSAPAAAPAVEIQSEQPPIAAQPDASTPRKATGADESKQAHSEGMIRTIADPFAEQTRGSEGAPVARQPAAKPRLAAGRYVQVGVFTHPANAAELKAKLEAQGIPVVVAARIQVGPFKGKQEAEAMREKLKEMGLTPLLITQ